MHPVEHGDDDAWGCRSTAPEAGSGPPYARSTGSGAYRPTRQRVAGVRGSAFTCDGRGDMVLRWAWVVVARCSGRRPWCSCWSHNEHAQMLQWRSVWEANRMRRPLLLLDADGLGGSLAAATTAGRQSMQVRGGTAAGAAHGRCTMVVVLGVLCWVCATWMDAPGESPCQHSCWYDGGGA